MEWNDLLLHNKNARIKLNAAWCLVIAASSLQKKPNNKALNEQNVEKRNQLMFEKGVKMAQAALNELKIPESVIISTAVNSGEHCSHPAFGITYGQLNLSHKDFLNSKIIDDRDEYIHVRHQNSRDALYEAYYFRLYADGQVDVSAETVDNIEKMIFDAEKSLENGNYFGEKDQNNTKAPRISYEFNTRRKCDNDAGVSTDVCPFEMNESEWSSVILHNKKARYHQTDAWYHAQCASGGVNGLNKNVAVYAQSIFDMKNFIIKSSASFSDSTNNNQIHVCPYTICYRCYEPYVFQIEMRASRMFRKVTGKRS